MFKLFSAIHGWADRLSGGILGGRMRGFNVLLLTTTGRKSSKTRTLPLGLFERPSGYLVVASNGGQPRHPSWYLNLGSSPQAAVQVLTTDPYRLVRHPMYAGAILLLLFAPLALGSLVAQPFPLPMILVVAIRSVEEEKLLRANLAGSTDYCQKVRYRLVPYIW